MPYLLSNFIPFSSDAGRVAAILEAAYEQWLDARQPLAAMPVSLYRQHKASGDHLAVKQRLAAGAARPVHPMGAGAWIRRAPSRRLKVNTNPLSTTTAPCCLHCLHATSRTA
jgi:hypothetical protein